MNYRLALDLGSTSIGWAVVGLDVEKSPRAIIKTGVRIFPDGRNPKDGSSLAVTRRMARAMRRRRDRLLARKDRMMRSLVAHGFFSADKGARKAMELIDPYALRAKGLDAALKPEEFARALFHINQRRGFKSNRKTDSKDNDSSVLKATIKEVQSHIDPAGQENRARTVGEWLHRRQVANFTVRAKYRETKTVRDDGKPRVIKSYDLYIDRAMIAAEFDALWAKQASLNPALYSAQARHDLRDCLLFQRPLRPVRPGRCTLIPDEERAPLALPSTQRFRILQECNHLRILREGMPDESLSQDQRDRLANALFRLPKRTFTQIKILLGLSGAVSFNFEDPKRQELKGDATAASMAKPDHFGKRWHDYKLEQQDAIVTQLVNEENETTLVRWLLENTDLDTEQAERVASAGLPEGYGSLSRKALALINNELMAQVVSYAEATRMAGFHHSQLTDNQEIPGRTFAVESIAQDTGEIKRFHVHQLLPYYGEFLQRHVGFASPDAKPTDLPEKYFGRIANPTVHIGLNQVRVVVNALIKRYGHPAEVVVEVARDLKQTREQRKDETRRQADNQKRNARLREEAAALLQCGPDQVRHGDIQKLILWEELGRDPVDRKCPYSGELISKHAVLTDKVEIEHILPFSQTLDDSLNNKTVAMRHANRVKGNRTPWQARHDFAARGWAYAGIEARAALMDKRKRYRFAADGYEQWKRDDKDFLARALNDTRYMSRVAREYMSLICPQATRVIPGQMTAMLRAKLGLNEVLGLNGEKNRNDHRHHAVDACVIGVTDQALLQRFAKASADARQLQLGRLVANMPQPWPTYAAHVRRAIRSTWVSFKPDHGHEGAMHNDTAYSLHGDGMVSTRKVVDGTRVRKAVALRVIEITAPSLLDRHGSLPDGSPKPYKGYKGDSNYCIEVCHDEKGHWQSHVVSTYEAYQLIRSMGSDAGIRRLRHATKSLTGRTLVMRLMRDDVVRLVHEGALRTMRVCNISANGQVFMSDLHESNVDSRNRSKDDPFGYVSKMAESFNKALGRRVTISPIGELFDPGPHRPSKIVDPLKMSPRG
jgi:CRISPR-associated endonuclease Csn1